VGSNGWSSLGDALMSAHDESLRTLLERGGDVNYTNTLNGLTLLMFAAFRGADACAKLLLAKQADVNVRNPLNHTALYYAAIFGRDVQLSALLKAGADYGGKEDRVWVRNRQSFIFNKLIQNARSEICSCCRRRKFPPSMHDVEKCSRITNVNVLTKKLK
jgi:ankyrin repeat protein